MSTEKSDVLENQSHGSIVGDVERSTITPESEKEWTVESVRKIRDEAHQMMGRSYEIDKAVADAHNAAIKVAYKKGKEDGLSEHYFTK